ncbi:histidine kinase [Reichenbachiella sp. MALMAid0571]|uniref:tetratricopeptide repeat-containing sensor histidine kinase n=1 Tax=Reichenbachiella sp. MALMAid0571 TaxID=3143939 RepID=UPI0032DEB4C1
MRKILLMPFLWFSFCVTAQENKQDSLIQALEIRPQKDSIRVDALIEAANYYQFKEFEKGLPYINEALEIAQEKELYVRQGIALRSLAAYYLRKGLYDRAIDQAIESLRVLEKEHNKSETLLSNSLLARLYRDKGFLDKALEINIKNALLVEDDPESAVKARYYFDLGNSYKEMKLYGKAESNYKIALEITKNVNFVPGQMMLGLTLGQHYKSMEAFDKAKIHLNKVLPYYVEQKQMSNVALVYYELATISSMEGKHKESIPLYNKSLDIYKQIGKLYFVKEINQRLFIAYNIVGDPDKAKEANEVYNLMNDSIDNQKTDKLIADMKTKYETEQIAAEKELAENRAELAEAESKQNLILFIAAVIITILIIVSASFYLLRIKQAKKAEMMALQLKESQKRLALEKQYRDSELKALKAQMNPHFIFNVLNSIQEFIILNKKDLASDYLATFAELIRSYLHFSNQGYISLADEIETLRKYLELEALRFGDGLQYFFDIEKGINSESKYIPTMIIQPYVENAIKHGLFHKKESKSVRLSFYLPEENVVQCIIEDDGIGRTQAKVIEGKKNKAFKSFATEATASRLELFNQMTVNKIGVETIDLLNDEKKAVGTKVILTIPLIKKQ